MSNCSRLNTELGATLVEQKNNWIPKVSIFNCFLRFDSSQHVKENMQILTLFSSNWIFEFVKVKQFTFKGWTEKGNDF